MKNMEDLFKGFSKLNREERFQRLLEMDTLTKTDVEYLKKGGIKDLSLADNFIENSIGYFQIPLGVATNFKIDGVDRIIPMAVEETSIIASASKTARWVRQNGTLTTSIEGQTVLGQIQIAKVQNYHRLEKILKDKKQEWILNANKQISDSMVRRGGGVEDIVLRLVKPLEKSSELSSMAVFHVHFNPCNAMGANLVNQICEFLKNPIEKTSGEEVTMCIVSNLVDSRLTEARVTLNNISTEMGEKIEQASYFAETDPYRAATSNKGVLNGVDSILIATGNDWRAVEAGVHAFACRKGQYSSITRWRYKNGVLIGSLKAPIITGTVGGVTSLHPTARLCLEMIKVQSASDLSRICSAVGLVQNLGAIKALTTVGIVEGHMKLHIKNLTMGVGASKEERKPLQKKLEQILAVKKKITHSDAWKVLEGIRQLPLATDKDAIEDSPL